MEPREIMTVTICLMLLVIGIFIVGVISTANEAVELNYDGYFGVTDPTVDQSCDTGEMGLTSIVVTKWDGVSWTTVDPAHISYADTTVTVASGGL